LHRQQAWCILHNGPDAGASVQDQFERVLKCVKIFYGTKCHTEKKYIVNNVKNTAADIYRRGRFAQNIEGNGGAGREIPERLCEERGINIWYPMNG